MARPPKNPLIPTRDGVSPSCVALPLLPAGDSRWPTLLDFLAELETENYKIIQNHTNPISIDRA